MDSSKCPLDLPEGTDCWINSILDGKSLDEISLPRDRVSSCVKCPYFKESVQRSMGRRSSDLLMSQAVSRLLSILSDYNAELSGMATDLHHKIEKLTVLKTVAEAFLKAANLKDCLWVFLTGVTAGEAYGFNRAAVFLVNQPRRALEGQLGIGHVRLEDFKDTWDSIKKSRLTFQEMIRRIIDQPDLPENHLTELVRKIYIPLTPQFGLLPKAVLERRSFTVPELTEEHITDRQMLSVFGGRPCAIVPIISRDSALGVVVVDNPVTGADISQEDISMLETLSYLAASKINNLILNNQLEVRVAELEHVYNLLQDNQEYLLETERLVEAGKLATTIAHEIKTPLVTIGGYSRRALKAFERGDNITRDLQILVEEIARLEWITSGVLDYSKKRTLNLRNVNLNSIINETLEIVQGKLTYGNIDVVLQLSESELIVKADKDRLKQVLFNLLDNAIQAMPDGGTLTVSTGTDGGYEWFKIVDSGCGMSQKTIDKLFQPFFTTRSSGVGLGLPVSQRIVADHGGYLEVSSELEHGSVFTVNLPVHRQEMKG